MAELHTSAGRQQQSGMAPPLFVCVCVSGIISVISGFFEGDWFTAGRYSSQVIFISGSVAVATHIIRGVHKVWAHV